MGAQFSGMGDADMDRRLRTIWTLFGTFLKIGAFTFGGGYAMIPLIQKEVVEKRNWITNEDVLDIIAIAESTPGPVAINSATYLGYKLAGVPGAAVATVAVSLPSFGIIYAISLFFDQFTSLTVVAHAFQGIQVCVIYLIFLAGVRMLKALERTPLNVGILLVVMACMIALSLLAVKFSSIAFILLSGMVGVAVWGTGRNQKGGR